MARYRMKPRECEAVQWFKEGDHPAVVNNPIGDPRTPGSYAVLTKYGYANVISGDWIITRGDDIDVCRKWIFESMYEPADS